MRKPLGVGSQQSMGVYLGCPMAVDGRNMSCVTSIYDRILKCISSWSYSFLSTIGRCTLINSVLVALAAHIMSIYLFPKKLLNKINSTILRFYWEGNKVGKPIHRKQQNCAKNMLLGCGKRIGTRQNTSILEDTGQETQW
ncbi:hypothetical protein RDABS01_004983 [Bienertia sinuspersici]